MRHGDAFVAGDWYHVFDCSDVAALDLVPADALLNSVHLDSHPPTATTHPFFNQPHFVKSYIPPPPPFLSSTFFSPSLCPPPVCCTSPSSSCGSFLDPSQASPLIRHKPVRRFRCLHFAWLRPQSNFHPKLRLFSFPEGTKKTNKHKWRIIRL